VIAENLKTSRNVVIMLPASLKPNFEKELLSLPEYKADPAKWKEKYSFVSYNASNTLDQIRKVGGFDNKVVIIDEVHNLVSKMVSGIYGISTQGKEIYELLHEFPFDSDRKRMSVILRKRNDKKIILLSKGADSVMFPRIGGMSPQELNEADD
jgi:magnesium-transporting ATPase (P-type)